MDFCKIPSMLHVGVSEEQYSRRPAIDISEMLKILPGGTPQLFVIRPGESESKPVTVTLEGTLLHWEVNGYDTQIRGNGSAQIVLAQADDPETRILQSRVIRTLIDTTILSDERDVPEPYEVWVAQILRAASIAATSASSASASAADALVSQTAAEASAEHAEQLAGSAGYMWVDIDEDGCLIYTRTDQVDADFYLDDDGNLIMEAV